MVFEDTLRATRNEKLAKSDVMMMQLLDSATSWSDFNSKRSALLTYRQALRDLPSHSNWPNLETNDWPTKP